LLRPGDLVLLKGNNVTDHLARLVLARTTGVACWRTRCRRKTFCGSCDLLHVPSGSPPDTTSIGVDPGRPAAGEHVDHIVIGLGNPEGRLATTRHNVGHRVVDALASRLGARWERRPTALVAPAPLGPGRTWLVKLLAPMNMAGAALGTLAREIDVDPSGIILVHDDLDRPAGTVGVRMRGSHGGHNGVRSILERFQSDEFPRVKIGIGRPAPPQRVDRYVLEPFTPDEQAVIDAAVARAVEQVTALVGRPRDAHPAAPRG
jgi:PTH1 family peptidyl-tRNA hydrolase